MATPLGFWWHVSAATAVPSATLIVLLATRQGLVSRALSIGPLIFGGEISYAMYLVHVPPLQHYWAHYKWLADEYPTWIVALGFVTVLVFISTFVWIAIENHYACC